MCNRWAAILLAMFLVGCGGGSGDSSNDGGGGTDYTPGVGVLLEGAATTLALDALESVGPLPVGPGDMAGSFLLTRLDLTLQPGATVQQINAALAAVEGGIVDMLPGDPSVVVAVPRQANGAALQALAATLAAQPGVRFAFASRRAVVRAAPPTPADAEDKLRYLHDQRFVAAWNARAAAANCGSSRVTIIAPDYYLQGDGVDFGIGYVNLGSQLPGITFPTQPAGSTELDPHGFDVLSSLAATLDEIPPTGAFPYPECLDIRPIEISNVGYAGMLRAIERAMPGTGNVIVTHSWGYASCLDAACDPADASTYDMPATLEMGKVAGDFKKLMNRYPDRMLTVSAAGNDNESQIAILYPGLGQAAYDSPINVAGTSDGEMPWVRDQSLWEPTTPCSLERCPPSYWATLEEYNQLWYYLFDEGVLNTPAPPVILVGNARAGGANEPAQGSEPGEDVYAIGEDVPTIPGSTTSGTSFASPQVSALAAYLWALSPELRALPVAETRHAIQSNICAFGCAGLIDAYATVLALDSGQALSTQNSRIRLAILNVDGQGGFDQADLAAYLAAFRPDGQPVDPIERDYSRHDLNGDGFTGGSKRAPFDLDPVESPRFGRAVLNSVNFEIAGEPVIYNEVEVTDEEILCYYAWSPLYTGTDLAAREDALAGICATVAVEIDPPGATVVTGDTVQFSASVRGSTNPAVTWSLPQGGGTISGDGAFTAGSVNGNYTVRAASVANPDATATVAVTVGIPRSWVGTLTITDNFSLAKRVDTPPSDIPSNGMLSLGSTYTLEQASSLSVTVPVEIEFQGILGTVEAFTLGTVSGSGSSTFAEERRGEQQPVGYEGCIIAYQIGKWVELLASTSASAGGFSLGLRSNGGYTLYIGTVDTEGPATERIVSIYQDAPSNETDCYAEVGNIDATTTIVSGVGGGGWVTEASGEITNGQMTGTATATVNLGEVYQDGSTGTETSTVTWSLHSR